MIHEVYPQLVAAPEYSSPGLHSAEAHTDHRSASHEVSRPPAVSSPVPVVDDVSCRVPIRLEDWFQLGLHGLPID